MSQIGTLAVRIGADTSGLRRGLREADSGLSRLSNQARATASRMAVLGAAAAAAGAALAVQLTRRGLEEIDTQTKLARSMDATIDGLRGYQEAAEDAGVSSQAAAQAAQMLNVRLGEARRGTGQAAEQLQRLGLDAEALSRMDVDERMATLADRMQELGFDSSQAGDALRNLGIRNRELTSLMTQGGDAIRAARQEVDQFGLSISAVDAANVERANDAMRRIGRIIEVIRQRLAVALAPVLEHVANLVNDAARESGGFRDQVDAVVERGVRGMFFVADAVEGLRRTFMLAGQAAATAFAGIIQGALEAADYIVNYPTRAGNELVRLLNRIPGIDIGELGMSGLGERINNEMAQARGVTQEGVAAMQETLNAPLPSSGLEQRLEAIRKAASDASEQTIISRRRAAEAVTGGDVADEEDDRAKEEAERHREQLQERLQRIREANMHEGELLEHRHEATLEKLREAMEMELLTQQEFDELKEETEQNHWERMEDIRKRGLTDMGRLQEASSREQLLAFSQAGNEMIASAGRINDGLFKAAQIGGAAQAFVATLTGQAEALKLGWPAGPIAAAKIGAQGFGLVAAIRSASKSGSGGGGSVGAGGVPATPTTDAGSPGDSGGPAGGVLSVQGLSASSLLTGDAVAGLAEELLDYQRRGGRVVFER